MRIIICFDCHIFVFVPWKRKLKQHTIQDNTIPIAYTQDKMFSHGVLKTEKYHEESLCWVHICPLKVEVGE